MTRMHYDKDARAIYQRLLLSQLFSQPSNCPLQGFHKPGVAPVYLRIHGRFLCHKFT